MAIKFWVFEHFFFFSFQLDCTTNALVCVCFLPSVCILWSSVSGISNSFWPLLLAVWEPTADGLKTCRQLSSDSFCHFMYTSGNKDSKRHWDNRDRLTIIATMNRNATIFFYVSVLQKDLPTISVINITYGTQIIPWLLTMKQLQTQGDGGVEYHIKSYNSPNINKQEKNRKCNTDLHITIMLPFFFEWNVSYSSVNKMTCAEILFRTYLQFLHKLWSPLK